MSHAFGKSGFLGLGTVGDILGGLAVGAGSLALGPEVGGILGLSGGAGAAIGGGLAGAGLGAAEGALGGGTPAMGALLGGAGGAAGGALSGGAGLGSFFGSNGAATAAPGVMGASDAVGSAGADMALPAGLGSDLGSGVSAAGLAAPSGVGAATPDLASTGALADGGGLTTAGGGFTSAPLTGAGGGGSGGILQSMGLTNGSGMPTSSALTGGVGALGLGYNLMHGANLSAFPGYNPTVSQAGALQKQGGQLASYLANGTLPPGAQAAIDEATNSAIQGIKAKYASMGLTGSTMELQDINMVKQNAAAQNFNIADQLLQQGVSETGMSSQLYDSILSGNVALNGQVMGSISNLVAAMAGGAHVGGGASGSGGFTIVPG